MPRIPPTFQPELSESLSDMHIQPQVFAPPSQIKNIRLWNRYAAQYLFAFKICGRAVNPATHRHSPSNMMSSHSKPEAHAICSRSFGPPQPPTNARTINRARLEFPEESSTWVRENRLLDSASLYQPFRNMLAECELNTVPDRLRTVAGHCSKGSWLGGDFLIVGYRRPNPQGQCFVPTARVQ
ncbi:hypothetical protein CERZMDRAFT_92876 [Cercospora zeae-maydis SCOH1-5]|uniref:Uncharacterized protein n=1 Tax=Cercospora zeae-maydis SCOH1-5 TaxID=717836 RepID=A0A6A6FU07_9PEZI|nr:hypothetical protein CERZMDRAFT_92876 [Cercospora zeae-maydis SCOH1-5]